MAANRGLNLLLLSKLVNGFCPIKFLEGLQNPTHDQNYINCVAPIGNYSGGFPFYFHSCAANLRERNSSLSSCQSTIANKFKNFPRCSHNSRGQRDVFQDVTQRGGLERKVRTSRVTVRGRKGRGLSEGSRVRLCAPATEGPREESQGVEESRHQSDSGKMDVIILPQLK